MSEEEKEEARRQILGNIEQGLAILAMTAQMAGIPTIIEAKLAGGTIAFTEEGNRCALILPTDIVGLRIPAVVGGIHDAAVTALLLERAWTEQCGQVAWIAAVDQARKHIAENASVIDMKDP